jgi:hypothetical protein
MKKERFHCYLRLKLALAICTRNPDGVTTHKHGEMTAHLHDIRH